MNSYEHHILYYGTQKKEDILASLEKNHKVPAAFMPIPASANYTEQPTLKNQVYHVNFMMKQADIYFLNKGDLYNKDIEPTLDLFNEYFGGSMNSIVFQELREARGLAYTARSQYQIPQDKNKSYYGLSYIGTQTDKLGDAMAGLVDLLNKMPESQKSFDLAKSTLIQQIRTDRITKEDILANYEKAKKLGLDHDIRKDVYTQIPKLTFADIKAFEEKYLKDKTHTILVVGDKKNLDFTTLGKYGEIKYLTLEDIFGY